MDYSLRKYQRKQIDFLRAQSGAKVCGIQSPTGTGKSIMVLSYIKEWMDEHPSGTAVLTTGFNALVFQMEEDAKSMGICCQLLIGASYLVPNCTVSDVKGKVTNFSYNNEPNGPCGRCDKLKYKRVNGRIVLEDNRPENCSRKAVADFISNEPKGGKLIITNHSYYLTMKDRIECDLLVVDEAHTFSDFYSSYNTYRMGKDMKMLLDAYCKQVKTPTAYVMKNLMGNRVIGSKIVKNAMKEMVINKILDRERADKYGRELEELYSSDDTSYTETDPANNELVKYSFYSEYDVPAKRVILLTATLDEYTKRMFGLTNRNQMYVEREPLDRYAGSYYMPVGDDFKQAFDSVMDEMERSNLPHNSGLVLCNTVENVEWVAHHLEGRGVAVCRTPAAYRNACTPRVLIGSKRYFQGVNVPDLDYVFLDKLPFATYDNKFRAYEYYLKKYTKCEPWSDYTLPLVKNALLQACGRLWRVNDYENKVYDNGTFIITDPRLNGRFKNLNEYVVKNKPGIKLVHMKENSADNPSA